MATAAACQRRGRTPIPTPAKLSWVRTFRHAHHPLAMNILRTHDPTEFRITESTQKATHSGLIAFSILRRGAGTDQHLNQILSGTFLPGQRHRGRAPSVLTRIKRTLPTSVGTLSHTRRCSRNSTVLQKIIIEIRSGHFWTLDALRICSLLGFMGLEQQVHINSIIEELQSTPHALLLVRLRIPFGPGLIPKYPETFETRNHARARALDWQHVMGTHKQ